MSDKFKDWVTDIVGLVVIIITIIMLWNSTWAWVPNGLIGLVTGLGVFLLPDGQLKILVVKWINKLLNNK